MIFIRSSRASQRGVTANRHETWARDAMDAEVSSARAFCADERPSRTAKACGPGTPGLVLSLRDVSQATVTNKVMDTGESTYNAVNTIAQGRPGVSAIPVVTTRVLFSLHTRLRVQPAPGFPCALCSQRTWLPAKTRTRMRRESVKTCLQTCLTRHKFDNRNFSAHGLPPNDPVQCGRSKGYELKR